MASIYESDEIDYEKNVLLRILKVKIGAIISVTQNLNQDGGIINGTRGYVMAVHHKVVIIDEEHTKDMIPVTKVKQKIYILRTKKTCYRVMFPLMLSRVSTIHQAQGFTIDVAHVYVDKAIFANGQAYTALSRV